jgi:transcriptional regulator with XRE-family HTH domain
MSQSCFENQSIFEQGGFTPVSVGKRLRELRTHSGYSIKSLAEKSNLSVNTLSLIENEKTSPSVSTLEQLAKALKIPLSCFFESGDEKPHVIKTQAGQRSYMLLEDVRIEDCGLGLEGQPLQPLMITLPPNMETSSDPIFHAGYEFVFCQSGQVDYYIKEKKYVLHEGDSLVLSSVFPHRWHNPYQEPAVYLLIMIPGDAGELSGEVHFQAASEYNG